MAGLRVVWADTERYVPLATRRGTFLVHKASVREIFLYEASPLPVGEDLDAS